MYSYFNSWNYNISTLAHIYIKISEFIQYCYMNIESV